MFWKIHLSFFDPIFHCLCDCLYIEKNNPIYFCKIRYKQKNNRFYFHLSIGLFILYLTITVIRNIVEPRLVGKQTELHPVLALASMLVGLHLFGIIGLFSFPILLSFLKKLNDDGTIRLYHTETIPKEVRE